MFAALRDKLARTRQVFHRIEEVFASGRGREEILDGLAEVLILADVGVPTTEKIIEDLRKKSAKSDSAADLAAALRGELTTLLSRHASRPDLGGGPAVIMIVGVNGGGKTTSTAKLARYYRDRGRRVMLAAADTFRAAAQEQLVLWGKRLGVPVVKGNYGADPASVAFDAAKAMKAQGADLLIVDTAGRIHTNTNLMGELEKIRRVVAREVPGAPQETLLVLDASVGQNAIVQAKEFLKVSGLTGVFLAKLDGTAKGGTVIGIADELALPIRFIGVGEGEEDLAEFDPEEFVKALLP